MANQRLLNLVQELADQGYSVPKIRKELEKKFNRREIEDALHSSFQKTSHISILSAPLLVLLASIPIFLFLVLRFAPLPDMTNLVFFLLLAAYPAIIAGFFGYDCARHYISERESLKYELLLGLVTGAVIFVLFINYAPKEIENIAMYFALSMVLSLFLAVFFTLLFRLFFHERILPPHEHMPMLNYKKPFSMVRFLRSGGDVSMILFIVAMLFLGYALGGFLHSLVFLVGFFIFDYLIDFSYSHRNEVLAVLAVLGFFALAAYLSYLLLILAALAFVKSMVYFYKTGRTHNFLALFNFWTLVLTFFAAFLFLALLLTTHIILPFFGRVSSFYLAVIYFIVVILTFPFLVRAGLAFLGRVTGKINFFAAFFPFSAVVRPARRINYDSLRYGLALGIYMLILALVIIGIAGAVFTANTYERNLRAKPGLIESVEPLSAETLLLDTAWKYPLPEGTVIPGIFLNLQTQYESQLQSYKNFRIPRVSGFEAFLHFVSGRVFDHMVDNVYRISRLNIRAGILREQAEILAAEFMAINANKAGDVDFLDRTRNLQEHTAKLDFFAEQLYQTVAPAMGLEEPEEKFEHQSFSPFDSSALFGKTMNDFLRHSRFAHSMTRMKNMVRRLKGEEFSNERFIEEYRRSPGTALSLEEEALRSRLLLHYLGKEYLEGCAPDDAECFSRLTLFVTDINVCEGAEYRARCREAFLAAFPKYKKCPDSAIVNSMIRDCR